MKVADIEAVSKRLGGRLLKDSDPELFKAELEGGPSILIVPNANLPPGGSHGVNVSVSWGYELHDVHVSARKWKRIRAGEAVMVKSIGWYEGQSFECRWYFDLNAEYTLIVSYGDDGADGFIGNIWDAMIESLDGVQR